MLGLVPGAFKERDVHLYPRSMISGSFIQSDQIGVISALISEVTSKTCLSMSISASLFVYILPPRAPFLCWRKQILIKYSGKGLGVHLK